jgi:hypothetical protein
MAAGLGFKTFTTGEVLTAADTNGYLMQGVLVFASSAARASAVTSPQEGQYSYLKDTNSTEYYDGAAWIAAPIGDITGVTAGTGISGGGTSGTVTVTNDMATTITAAGDIVVGTGSGTYDNLPIGTTAQVLTADTTVSPYKVKWATPATSSPTFVGCAIWTNATPAWTQNVQTVINYPNEAFKSETGFHDNATNNSRITIPAGKAGKYLVTVNTLTPDDWNGYGYTYLFKNGTAIQEGLYNDGRFGSQVETAGVNQLNASTTVTLAVADYLEMKIQSAWTTANHTLYSRFTATWLGA